MARFCATELPAEGGAPASSEPLAAEWAAGLIQGRRTVLPKRLGDPGPTPEQLNQILCAAGAAPDHGELLPWRFVVVPPAARGALADVFAESLRLRDGAATPDQLAQAREKAFRAPLLMLAIARLDGPDAEIPDDERLVSAGCALQNMLLMASALGFGSALTSGKALAYQGMRELFSLGAGERALCFLSVGTVLAARRGRQRPGPERYASELVLPGSPR